MLIGKRNVNRETAQPLIITCYDYSTLSSSWVKNTFLEYKTNSGSLCSKIRGRKYLTGEEWSFLLFHYGIESGHNLHESHDSS